MRGVISSTIDHEVIRKWVEDRGGWPAKFLRIYFHAYAVRGAFPRVQWEEFFRTFEERQLAFLYQDHTANGRQSYFCRLVSRRTLPAADRVAAPEPRIAAAAETRPA